MKNAPRLVLRVIVSGAFLLSGISKAADPFSFAATLLQSPLLPLQAAIPSAFFIPWLEILTATALWIPSLAAAARGMLLALLGIFSAYLAVLWAAGIVIPCGCFGGLLPETGPGISLIRNALLAAAVWFSLQPGICKTGEILLQKSKSPK